MTTSIGIGVVGFGWMGHAHWRSYRNIPVCFPDAGIDGCDVDPYALAEGGAWWEVGAPEVSDREPARGTRAQLEARRKHQRVGS